MNPNRRSGRWLDRLPVGRQLFVAFTAMLVLTAVLGATALVGLRSVDGEAVLLSSKWLKGVGNLSDARTQVLEARAFEVKHSRTDDTSYHAEYEDKMAESAKLIGTALDVYKSRVDSPQETELVLDPAFFLGWAARQPFPVLCEVLPKTGDYDNELARYRFDVRLPCTHRSSSSGLLVRASSLAASSRMDS